MGTCPSYQSLRHFGPVAEGHWQSGCQHQTCDHDGHEEAEVATRQSLMIDNSLSGPRKKMLQHLASVFILATRLKSSIHQSNLPKPSNGLFTLLSTMSDEIHGLLNKSETDHGNIPDRLFRTKRIALHSQGRVRSAETCPQHRVWTQCGAHGGPLDGKVNGETDRVRRAAHPRAAFPHGGVKSSEFDRFSEY
jgi:hypothetical protein